METAVVRNRWRAGPTVPDRAGHMIAELHRKVCVTKLVRLNKSRSGGSDETIWEGVGPGCTIARSRAIAPGSAVARFADHGSPYAYL